MNRSSANLLLLLAFGAWGALGEELPQTFEVTARSGLIVRDAADGERVDALPKGTWVEVLEREGEWARIGDARYVHADYLRPAAASLSGTYELVGSDSQRGDYRVTLELRAEGDGVGVRRTARYRNRNEVQVGRGRVVGGVLSAALSGHTGADDALTGGVASGPVSVELRRHADGSLALVERSARGDGEARRAAPRPAAEGDGRSGRGVLVAIKRKLADELRSGISIDEEVRLGDYLHVGVGAEVRAIPDTELSPAQAEARIGDPSRVWLEHTVQGGARVNAGTTVPLGEVSLGVGFEAGARIDYTVVDFYRAPGPGLSTGGAIAEAFKGMAVRTFDLPLTAEDARALRPGARRVLEGRGHVAVSGNLSFGYTSPGSPARLEAAVKVGGYYRLSGRVRIEVERERGNTVWVRLSRARTRERGVHADVVLRAALDEGRIKEELSPAVDYIDESLIDTRKLSAAERDAILSAGADATNGIVRRLTRFRLRVSASNAKERRFSVAYRFDLGHAEARRAYRAAVRGDFRRAGAASPEQGVTLDRREIGVEERRHTAASLDLSVFLRASVRRTISIGSLVVQEPQGVTNYDYWRYDRLAKVSLFSQRSGSSCAIEVLKRTRGDQVQRSFRLSYEKRRNSIGGRLTRALLRQAGRWGLNMSVPEIPNGQYGATTTHVEVELADAGLDQILGNSEGSFLDSYVTEYKLHTERSSLDQEAQADAERFARTMVRVRDALRAEDKSALERGLGQLARSLSQDHHLVTLGALLGLVDRPRRTLRFSMIGAIRVSVSQVGERALRIE